MRLFPVVLICCLYVFTSACAKKQDSIVDLNNASMPSVTNAGAPSQSDNYALDDDYDFDDYDALDDYGDFEDYKVEERADPLFVWNKTWFKFNDITLTVVVKPVFTGYTKVVPKTIRSGIGNFKHNFTAPVRMSNALLQAEFGQFCVEFGRFTINVITSAGFADVASRNKVLVPHTPQNLRLGYTFAKWNIPRGSYMVIPFYGPSTVREGCGRIGDVMLNPLSAFIPWEVSFPLGALLTVNDFGKLFAAYETLKENSFDPYLSLRNAYLERLKHNEPH